MKRIGLRVSATWLESADGIAFFQTQCESQITSVKSNTMVADIR